ncbi:Uncharacterised protein [Bordetella pertussis]|nr:Uncharacterised protein [Bordetella pertussis]
MWCWGLPIWTPSRTSCRASAWRRGADIHAAAVDSVDGAQMEIDQVIENMNPGDVAVFFCADGDCYGAALDLLGLPVDE